MAVSSPLLEDISIAGAEALLVNICGGPGLSLHEVHEANSIIVDASGDDANVIFGAVIDPNLGDDIRITVIATGFGKEEMPARRAEPRRDESRREEPRVFPVAAALSPSRSLLGESRLDFTVPVARADEPMPVVPQRVTGRGELGEEEEARQIRLAREAALKTVRENLKPVPAAQSEASPEPEPETVAAGQAEARTATLVPPGREPAFVEATLSYYDREKASPAPPVRPRTNLDRWATSYTRDNLDIPAFIRRQQAD
jgi:cell division protein FtsZ